MAAAEITDAWRRIEAWLAERAPSIRASLRGPVDEAAVRAIEMRVDRPLPADLRASWAIHDGQEPHARLLWCLDSWQLLSAAESMFHLDVWSANKAWRAGLVPIAASFGDVLAIDLFDPSSGWVHTSEGELVVREQGPIAVWLETFARELERGRYVLGASDELEPVWPVDSERTIDAAADALVARCADRGEPHEATDAQERELAVDLERAFDQPSWAIAWKYPLARALWNAWDRLDRR